MSQPKQLAVRETKIPGFYVVDLVVIGDNRGWFKENYQAEKMQALGLPSFQKGVTRGLHAEPWEKYISVANGSVFGAWVDLRSGASFGTVLTLEITPDIAVFVPRGIANGYQTLSEHVVYTYLVNAHWSADADYKFVNLFDPELGIDWPIDQAAAIISDKDAHQPMLHAIQPFGPSS
jgi:dTDP-4-dehydrorhamnose 3,5-epimerase